MTSKTKLTMVTVLKCVREDAAYVVADVVGALCSKVDFASTRLWDSQDIFERWAVNDYLRPLLAQVLAPPFADVSITARREEYDGSSTVTRILVDAQVLLARPYRRRNTFELVVHVQDRTNWGDMDSETELRASHGPTDWREL